MQKCVLSIPTYYGLEGELMHGSYSHEDSGEQNYKKTEPEGKTRLSIFICTNQSL